MKVLWAVVLAMLSACGTVADHSTVPVPVNGGGDDDNDDDDQDPSDLDLVVRFGTPDNRTYETVALSIGCCPSGQPEDCHIWHENAKVVHDATYVRWGSDTADDAYRVCRAHAVYTDTDGFKINFCDLSFSETDGMQSVAAASYEVRLYGDRLEDAYIAEFCYTDPGGDFNEDGYPESNGGYSCGCDLMFSF